MQYDLDKYTILVRKRFFESNCKNYNFLDHYANPSGNWSKICNCAFALIECKMQQWLYYCRPKNKWNRWGENNKKFSTYLNHFSHFLSQRDSGTFCIWIHYLLEVDQNIPTLMSFEQGNSIENECNFPTLDFGLIFAKRDTIALYKMELK